MPNRFNQTSWPPDGPHRELLEFLDAVHSRHGCRPMRKIGRDMNLAHTRVYDIVRGASLPVDEEQARSLVKALTAESDAETHLLADQAAELLVKARRARDEADDRVPRPGSAAEAEPSTPAARVLGDKKATSAGARSPASADAEEMVSTEPVEISRGRWTLVLRVVAAVAVLGVVIAAILVMVPVLAPGSAPAATAPSAREQAPTGVSAGRLAAPSMNVTPQNPGGCSPNYVVEVTASGNDPRIVDKRLWIVSELYADLGRNDPNSLYFAKTPVILRDGKFLVNINGNTEPGVRKERYLLVASPSDAANADLQLSLSSDRAHDNQYPDYRRTTLQLGNAEIATGPDLVQRC